MLASCSVLDFESICCAVFDAEVCCNLFAVQAAVAALISLTDVVGLWYALSKFSHRNISNSHKFQAVGLGNHTFVIAILVLLAWCCASDLCRYNC